MDTFASFRIATKGGVSSWQNASKPSPGQVVEYLVSMVLALSNEKNWCPWFWHLETRRLGVHGFGTEQRNLGKTF